MTITKEPFGVTSDGTQVERFLVENSRGVFFAAISFGAILQSVRLPDRSNQTGEVTLGFDTLEFYEAKHPFFGATVGRFANRIRNARFEIRGKTYVLEANNGPNTLHGGLRGFDKYVWSAEMFGDSESAGVTFSRTSPDGEEGFPGTLWVSVTYSLNEDGALSVDYHATSDAPTPINLTNHSYWNLAGAGSGTILDHHVQLNASRYLPVDDATLPTGEIRPVDNTPFDFRSGKRVGADIEEADIEEAGGGYDHCFVVDRDGGDTAGGAATPASEASAALSPVARVEDPQSGRVMEIESTMPGVQLYTGNKLAGVSDRSSDELPKHAALCLETQFYPDSPNQPEFPSSILRPGEKFAHRTVHRFSTK